MSPTPNPLIQSPHHYFQFFEPNFPHHSSNIQESLYHQLETEKILDQEVTDFIYREKTKQNILVRLLENDLISGWTVILSVVKGLSDSYSKMDRYPHCFAAQQPLLSVKSEQVRWRQSKNKKQSDQDKQKCRDGGPTER